MKIKKDVKSVSLLFFSTTMGSMCTFFVYIVLARQLGAENYGLFSAAFSLATIASITANFGIPQVWLKVFGSEGWGALSWVRPSLILLVLTTVISCSIMLAWSEFGPHDSVSEDVLSLMTLFVLGQAFSESMVAKLQLEEKYMKVALLQFAPHFLRLISVLGLIYVARVNINPTDIAWIYGLVGLITFAVFFRPLRQFSLGNFVLAGHECTRYQNSLTPKSHKDVFKEAWPFGFGAILAFVYLQIDIIMLKYISGDREAGLYNVGFVVLTAIMLFPVVLFSKFLLPKYYRWSVHDREKFFSAYKRGNIIMIISGIFTALIVFLLSDFGVPFVFGEEYKDSIILVKILAIVIPLNFLAYSVGATLVTTHHIRTKIKIMGLVAVTNVVLNLGLIPYFGSSGAAAATVISSALLLGFYYFIAKHRVFIGV